jgi:hypothetical protein
LNESKFVNTTGNMPPTAATIRRSPFNFDQAAYQDYQGAEAGRLAAIARTMAEPLPDQEGRTN